MNLVADFQSVTQIWDYFSAFSALRMLDYSTGGGGVGTSLRRLQWGSVCPITQQWFLHYGGAAF